MPSGLFFLNGGALLLAHAAVLFNFSLATASNLCFYSTYWALAAQGHCSFVLVLLGASSFSFHLDSEDADGTSHKFDVLSCMLLAADVSVALLFARLEALLGGKGVDGCLLIGGTRVKMERAVEVARLGASVLSTHILVVEFDRLLGDWWNILLAGSPLFLAAFALRASRHRVVAVLGCLLSAALTQCELLLECDERSYDSYHGYWHFFVASAVGMVYLDAKSTPASPYESAAFASYASFVSLFRLADLRPEAVLPLGAFLAALHMMLLLHTHKIEDSLATVRRHFTFFA